MSYPLPLRKRLVTALTGLSLSVVIAASACAKTDFPADQVDQFVKRMEQHGFSAAETRQLIAQAEHKQAIIDAISRPAEGVLHWHKYRQIFLKPARIEAGAEFWKQHADTLHKAEQQFGVPAEYIVAIIGVETRFGRFTGKWRVIDALTTLGFNYPKRGKFFTSELEHYMLMTREQKLDPLALKGSYAGAMGLGQFISSSYRNFAIDFDGDEIADLWNIDDAIGSIANYFVEHRWQPNQPVAFPAVATKPIAEDQLSLHGKPAISWQQLQQQGIRLQQGKIAATEPVALLEFKQENHSEYWVPLNNFYVITRYNHSKLYAMAVHQLAQAIKAEYNP